jgi:hypothetical protein
MLTKLSYDSTSLSLTDSWCYSAIGSACVQAGTFGGSVGLATMRGGRGNSCGGVANSQEPNAL